LSGITEPQSGTNHLIVVHIDMTYRFVLLETADTLFITEHLQIGMVG